MRFDRRSSGFGYTTASTVIILGIALGAMFVTDRSGQAGSGPISDPDRVRVGIASGSAPRQDSALDGQTVTPAVGANDPHVADQKPSIRHGAIAGSSAQAAAEDTLSEEASYDPQSTVAPVIEGSEAERSAALATASRMPERAPIHPSTAAEPRPEPRSTAHRDAIASEGDHSAILLGLETAEIERLEVAARLPGPLEVGPVRPLDATPSLLELPIGGSDERLRAFSIRSTGAASMRIHFSRFDVDDAEVLVYAGSPEDPTVLGPYTGRGPNGAAAFWTGVLPGDEVIVEVSGGNGTLIEVDQVLHAQLGAGVEQAARSGDGLLTCHEDVMCHSVDQIARDAVGQLSYMKDGAGFACTGTLIADHDEETVVPYLLTAYHCIGSQAVADTLNVTWLFQSSSCGAAAPTSSASPMSPNGADLVRTNTGNDMTLLRLRDPVPPGVGLAGWTTSTGVSGAYGVHHPYGSYKRYTDLEAVGICPNCLCKDPTDYDFYDMQDGFTQGGSSGSAVFDGQGRVAGQLWGSCSKGFSHPDDMTCGTTGDYWAVYGEFDTTHGKIRRWLEIGGTIRVDAAAGATGLGTPSSPFGRITDAEAFAWDGVRIELSAGSYSEPIELRKPMTLIAEGGVATIGQ